MIAYLEARAEETLETLLDATAQAIADEVATSVREGLSGEIAAVREQSSATQRECSRIGRELVRSGATMAVVQETLANAATALQQLEAAVHAEQELSRRAALETRASEMLDDVLATLDGLETALAEAGELSRTLNEVARQIDDPMVRRWWRAMGEATGTKRPLPALPSSDVEAWVRGLEITYRRLKDALERRGIAGIEVVGRPFDPYVAEAVAVDPCSTEQDSIVLREELKGYRTIDRVIRLAQVVVGKAEPLAEKKGSFRRKATAADGNGVDYLADAAEELGPTAEVGHVVVESDARAAEVVAEGVVDG